MSVHDNLNQTEKQVQDSFKEKATVADVQSDIVTIFDNGGASISLKSKDYLRAAKGWVYGCVDAISSDMASIPIRLFKAGKDGREEVDEHAAIDLIYRANNVTTKYDLIKRTVQNLELTGEAPWFIYFVQGKPAAIVLLRPDWLKVLPGDKENLIGGYEYTVAGEVIKLEPIEVIHFKYPDPANPLRGAGPLQAAAQAYDLDEYAQSFNKQFFKNGASPGAALETDRKLTKETRDRLRQKIEAQYGGYSNAHKFMILEQGLKFSPISLSQTDMQFMEQQKFNRDKILAIFRVPRTVLGLTDDVNRANAEATDYVFARRTIKPKMEGFVHQLNEFLLPLYDDTDEMYFDFDDPTPENRDEKIKEAQTGVSTGYITINEAREIMGMDPIDGGDELREPGGINLLKLEDGSTMKAKRLKKVPVNQTMRRQAKVATKHLANIKRQKALIAKGVEKAVVPFIFNELKKNQTLKMKRKAARKLKIFSGSDDEKKKAKVDFQTVQLRLGERLEPMFKRAMNKLFDDQLKEVRTQVGRGNYDYQIKDEDWKENYQEKLEPLMQEVIKKQSRRAFRLVGQDNELVGSGEKRSRVSRKVNEYLRKRIFDLSFDLTKTTNDKLGKALAEGVKAGEGIVQLKKRVSELFKDMEKYRSERIARTEVMAATNFATEEAFVESDVVKGKEWLPFNPDDDECNIGGEEVALGATFSNGVQYPPVHPNCRCTIVPVVL